MNNKYVEVLSPAGSYESFIAACQNGADAVYMGIDKFNARQMAKNFGIEEYISCIDYAHKRNVKVYLTLNTLVYDDEIKEALSCVLKLYKNGLDAVIVQDIGLAMLIKEMIPDIPLHASTQMSVYSLSQVKYLESLGFKRVVLARELSIDEIEYICKNTNVEIEVFVHGALCVSFSGQCLLSATIGGRSANRGKCAQPCRMKYTLCNKDGREVVKNTYIMSKKDIFGLEYIDKLIKSGVVSLKLEGRNKTPEYVAGVTSVYKKYVSNVVDNNNDNFRVDEEDFDDLIQLFNRNGKSDGYLLKREYKNSITEISPKNMGKCLGKVIAQRGVYIKVRLQEDIDLHDGIEIYLDDGVFSNIVTCIKDENGKIINKEAKKGEYVWIGDVSKKIPFGLYVYKTSSDKLNKRYRFTFENNVQNKKTNIYVNLDIIRNKNICFEVLQNDKSSIKFSKTLDIVPEIAIKRAICKEDITNNFSKTKDFPYDICINELKLDDNLFLSSANLNEISNEILKIVEASFVIKRNVYIDERDIDKILDEFISKKLNTDLNKKNNFKNSLFVYSFNKDTNYLTFYQNKYCKKLDRIYVSVVDYYKYSKVIKEKYIGKIEVYINIPNVVFKNTDKIILDNLSCFVEDGISGFLLGSLTYLNQIKELKSNYNFEIVADYSLNVSNIYSAMFLKSIGFDVIVPSYDISITDIENMSKYVNIEIVNDIVTVMTSRYCILGSFLAGRESDDKMCTKPCKKGSYYLRDSYGYKINIVCDDVDCVMRLTKSIRNIQIDEYEFKNLDSVRFCIL